MGNLLSTGLSTRPYLIRALHEWCGDQGLTPYLAVRVDASVEVPREFVKNGEIVLNISIDATSGLVLGNEFIQFKARFGGVARDILVPVSHVLAIYARENGQGMAFPQVASNAPDSAAQAELPGDVPARRAESSEVVGQRTKTHLTAVVSADHPGGDDPKEPPRGGKPPSLHIVK